MEILVIFLVTVPIQGEEEEEEEEIGNATIATILDTLLGIVISNVMVVEVDEIRSATAVMVMVIWPEIVPTTKRIMIRVNSVD